MALDTATYKNRLEDSLAEIVAELKSIGIHNPENSADWEAVPDVTEMAETDENSAADRVEEWDERRAIVAELETRYNNTLLALKKIEEDVYGICEICGNEIEEDRLMANPSARTDKAHINDEVDLVN